MSTQSTSVDGLGAFDEYSALHQAVERIGGDVYEAHKEELVHAAIERRMAELSGIDTDAAEWDVLMDRQRDIEDMYLSHNPVEVRDV